MNKKNLAAFLAAVAIIVSSSSCAQPEDDGYRDGEQAVLSQPETSEAEQRTESPEAQPETERLEPEPDWTVTEIGKTPWFLLEITNCVVDTRSPLENWYLPDASYDEISYQLFSATAMQKGRVTGYVDSNRDLNFHFDYVYSLQEDAVVFSGKRVASFDNGGSAIRLGYAMQDQMRIAKADGEIIYMPLSYEEERELWQDFVLLKNDFTLADRQLTMPPLELTDWGVISNAYYHEPTETYMLVYSFSQDDRLELFLYDKQDNITVIPLESVKIDRRVNPTRCTFFQSEQFLYLFDESRQIIHRLNPGTWAAELVEDTRRQEVVSAFPEIEWMGEWYLPAIPTPPFVIEPKKDSDLVLVVDAVSGDVLYEMENYYYLIGWEECDDGYRALFQCSYDLPTFSRNIDISNQPWDFRS